MFFAAIATGLVATPVLGASVIVNGSFESGELGPWDAEMSFDPAGAEVLMPGRLDSFALHLDALEYDDYYHITQDVVPVSTDLITQISLWSFSPTPRWGHSPSLIFLYSDGMTDEHIFPLTSDWTFVDALGALSPGKTLVQVELSWAGLGDEGPSSELFVDDISIEAVPVPGTVGMIGVLGGCALGRRRRRSSESL